ncbi:MULTISPECIES: amidohydrolase family protein [Paenibacillus]|uniref:amidohydrolase family protein n=1 Tax=Paenibacillus TaxID=44249 RepID=UPI0022B89715|nr:amidohydrolase family protein [Paenibacillus caseinilyticus]MCZ8519565.1 amidohydrolase family protein [Paenibacillus caseinilyticus]
MRIDAHQHFIDYSTEEYPWIGEGHEVLKRSFLPGDLKPLLESIGFEASVAVQARQSLKETEWLLQLAEEHDWIKGVVGWVDLCSPEVERQLEQFAGHPRLKGVRHVIHDEPDLDFMLREDFLRGLSRLSAYGLTYDLLLFEQHLPNAVTVVNQFPELRFVLDHLAKPRIAGKSAAGWSRDVRRLAQSPNVYCKLSGMVTEADWGGWKPEEFTPFLDVVFDAFGPERLMIGSDWPVCTLSRDYRAVMGIVTGYLEAYPSDVRDQVLGGNCARFYGIDQGQA